MNVNPEMSRIVLIVLVSSTLVGCWFNFAILMLLWKRSRRIDLRNALLDQRVAAIGEVIVQLYPSQGTLPAETRASKKAKALSILRRIDDRDLDEVRLAIHEVTRKPSVFES